MPGTRGLRAQQSPPENLTGLEGREREVGQSAPQTFEGRYELDSGQRSSFKPFYRCFFLYCGLNGEKCLQGQLGFWLQYCEWPLGKNGRAAIILVWYPALILHPRSAPGWGGTVPERSPGASHDPPWRADLGLKGELLLHVLQD